MSPAEQQARQASAEAEALRRARAVDGSAEQVAAYYRDALAGILADLGVRTTAAAFAKRCNCCGATYARAAWDALPLVALDFDAEGDGAELQTMRNCPCGSTLCITRPGPNPRPEP